MLNLFKKKTELNILRKEFSFLEKDFGYRLLSAKTQDFFKGLNVLIYRNESAYKQLEICGGGSFFHCIIRRIKNGELSEYSDDQENVGFEDLAIIDNPEYNHFDFYAGTSSGVIGATKNTVSLFKRQKGFLINAGWFNLEKIRLLKNEYHESQFGTSRPKLKVSFKDKVKKLVKEDFKDFELIFDNSTFPHFHEDSTLSQLIYRVNTNEIKIRQVDWRDFPLIYRVFINESLIAEIDAGRLKDKEAIGRIKNACSQVYST